MGRFIYKRILQMIPVLILVSIVSFMIVHLAPGDPLQMYTTPGLASVEMTEDQIQELRENIGLDGSVAEQYLKWAKHILQGNWGKSASNFQPVKDQIFDRLPATIGLMTAALLLSVIIAIPLGLIAGMHKNKLIDNIISFFSYIGISIPQFWFGILLIIVFSLKLSLLPSSGMRTIGVESTWDVIRHGILPAVVLAFGNMAIFVRYVRSSTITQLEEDYVITAVSKGESQRRILFRQVLKNCLLPVITVVGMNFASLVTGSLVVESVFGWPGLGTLIMSAINNRDYPVIMGTTMLTCVILLLGNFLSDILYGIVDPRIKQGKKGV